MCENGTFHKSGHICSNTGLSWVMYSVIGVRILHIDGSEIESESIFGKNKLNQSDVVQ